MANWYTENLENRTAQAESQAKFDASQAQLAASQAQLAESQKRVAEAQASIDSTNAGIATLSSGQSGLASGQGIMGQTLTDQFGNVLKGQRNITNDLTRRFVAAEGGQIQLLGGQRGLGTQIGDVNTNVGTMQTAVDQGFNNTLQGQTDLGTQMTSGFDATGAQMTEGFDATGAQMTSGFDNAGTQLSDGLATTNDNMNTSLMGVQGSVQGNADALANLSGNVDAYSTQTIQNQEGIAAGQEQYTTKFDDYIARYTDDTTLANQTRADLQTAQGNAAEASQQQLKSIAGNQASGDVNLQGSVESGFTALADAQATAVESGFANTVAEQQDMTRTMTALREDLTTGLQGIDANTQQQYQSMVDSFDAQGNLIASSIDAQGNTITREMDAQGNLVTNTLDQQGNLLSSTSMNVNTMLTDAKTFQQQTQQSLATTQGLMSEQGQAIQQGQVNAVALQQGFDSVNGTLDTQTRNLAKIASMQAGMTQQQRQTYGSLAASFDDQGKVIANSIDSQGNTITRALDNQGNLILRTFDMQGRSIGAQGINLASTLSDLAQLQQYTGANAGMGGLTQPNQGGMAQTGGFANPYTIT